MNHNLVEFLFSGLKGGWLYCYETKKDERIIALNFYIINKNYIIDFLNLYEQIPYLNIGIAHRILSDLREQKVNKVFLGRGLYDYKIKNFAPSIKPLINIVIANKIHIIMKEMIQYFFISFLKRLLKR